jgi:hypothetical protein
MGIGVMVPVLVLLIYEYLTLIYRRPSLQIFYGWWCGDHRLALIHF